MVHGRQAGIEVEKFDQDQTDFGRRKAEDGMIQGICHHLTRRLECHIMTVCAFMLMIGERGEAQGYRPDCRPSLADEKLLQ